MLPLLLVRLNKLNAFPMSASRWCKLISHTSYFKKTLWMSGPSSEWIELSYVTVAMMTACHALSDTINPVAWFVPTIVKVIITINKSN